MEGLSLSAESAFLRGENSSSRSTWKATKFLGGRGDSCRLDVLAQMAWALAAESQAGVTQTTWGLFSGPPGMHESLFQDPGAIFGPTFPPLPTTLTPRTWDPQNLGPQPPTLGAPAISPVNNFRAPGQGRGGLMRKHRCPPKSTTPRVRLP